VGQLHPAEGHVRAGRHRQRLGRQGLHQRRAGAAGLRRPRHADLPKDQLDKEGINKAILGIKNYKTDILCKPWYFQDMPVHVPNNTDRTVTPKDGKMVEAEGVHRHPRLERGPEDRPRLRGRERRQQGLTP
jgi:hypothetical protein